MSDAVWIAIVGGVVATLTLVMPLVAARLASGANRRDKLEDWRRLDEVANRAAEAARLLLESSERVADSATQTNTKLDVIHGLVNSALTAAKQGELNALKGQLASMEDAHVTAKTKVVIEALKVRVSELSAEIDVRLDQQKAIDAAAATATAPTHQGEP